MQKRRDSPTLVEKMRFPLVTVMTKKRMKRTQTGLAHSSDRSATEREGARPRCDKRDSDGDGGACERGAARVGACEQRHCDL